MNDSTALSGAVTLHVVQAGDSLSKLAATYLGDAARYPEIAARNNMAPNGILTIGQRLIIPAATVSVAPESPGGSVPVNYGGELIETVTTTAKKITPFWQDWRFWLGVGGAGAIFWLLSQRGGRK